MQLDACLFRRAAGTQAPDAAAGAWWAGMSASLRKLFLGPRATVTRLHYDAGDAHGWLAQLWGAKLFVLFPPQDTPLLARIPEEARWHGERGFCCVRMHFCMTERIACAAAQTETVQSDVDPLAPPGHAAAPPPGATPYVALLQPGEAVIIPRCALRCGHSCICTHARMPQMPASMLLSCCATH